MKRAGDARGADAQQLLLDDDDDDEEVEEGGENICWLWVDYKRRKIREGDGN